MKNYFRAYRNIFTYKGEASIDEFWTVFAINLVVTLLMTIATAFWRKFDPSATDLSATVLNIYRGISLLVMFSIGYKRLKNAGLSGFLFLIPIVNLGLAALPKKKVVI